MSTAVLSSNPGLDHKFIQLGFPATFAEVIRARGSEPAWFGTPLRGSKFSYTDGDEDEDPVMTAYARQKKEDADYMALAGVQATDNSRKHYVSFPSNYDVPKPVLSQRRFANPSLGSGSADIYAPITRRVDWDSYPLSGGVLRTREGQEWAARKLKDRVKELDAIDEGTARFTQYEAPEFANIEKAALISQGVEEAEGPKLYLELSALLTQITTAIQSGKYTALVLGDLFKFLKILFRVGATANRDELNDILAVVSESLESIRGIATDPRPNPAGQTDKGFVYLRTLEAILTQTREYLNRMLVSVDKSPKDRKAASRAAVRNLQFTRAVGKQRSREDISEGDVTDQILSKELDDAEAELKGFDDNLFKEKGKLLKKRTAREEASKRGRRTDGLDRGILAVEVKIRELKDLIREKKKEIANIKKERKQRGKRSLPTIEVEDLDEESGRAEFQNRVRERGTQEMREETDARREEIARRRGELAGTGRPVTRSQTARFTRDTRAPWAARQGVYHGESYPEETGIIQTGRRAMKSASLPTTAPIQRAPIFTSLK